MADWLTEAPFAHRGLHDATAPENSFAAFVAAQQAGFGIELDVRLTHDGIPVIFHDNAFRRMTGHRGTVSSMTLGDLIGMRLKNSDQAIPTLQGVLHAANGKSALLLDLKSESASAGQLESTVGDEVKRYNGPVALMSMSVDSVRQVLSKQPNVVCGWVIERSVVQASGDSADLIEMLIREGLDFVACDRRTLPHRWASNAREAGLPVLAWTVTSARAHMRLQDLVDNIIFEKFLPRERPTT
jgi:glycerophosphoryl diester phosphodiesterase